MIKSFQLIVISLLIVGCAHSVHEVHVSDFAAMKTQKKGKWIEAEAKQFAVLGIVNDTDYVNQARAKLIAKCPKGTIQSITTRYSTSLSFFSWDNKIFMQGLCIK